MKRADILLPPQKLIALVRRASMLIPMFRGFVSSTSADVNDDYAEMEVSVTSNRI